MNDGRRRHGDTPIVSCHHIIAGQHQHVDMYYRSDQTGDVFFIVYSGCSEDGCNVLYVENCEVVDMKLLTKQAFSRFKNCNAVHTALPVPVLSLETFGRCRM